LANKLVHFWDTEADMNCLQKKGHTGHVVQRNENIGMHDYFCGCPYTCHVYTETIERVVPNHTFLHRIQ